MRQAHRLPPVGWEQALFAMLLLVSIALIVTALPNG